MSPSPSRPTRAGSLDDVTTVHDPSVSTDAVEPRAADGRVPGRRGMATRQRLLTCTGEMLRTTAYRDLKVVDIAREAKTSPATFYQYFPDVESAVLVLAEDLSAEGDRFAALIRSTTWRGRSGLDGATALADAFLRFWEEHRPILKVIDLATFEGDARFRAIRASFLAATAEALTDAVRDMREVGRHSDDIDPAAMAGVLVSMLVNVAAHRRGLEDWGVEATALRTAMARIIFWSVSGQKPRQPV
jgi:AcrR family transcriptional regulator